MDLIGIYRTFHPKSKEYNVFPTLQGTISKINHIVGQKTHLNRYNKIKIIMCILVDLYGVRVVFNTNKKQQKYTYIWKMNTDRKKQRKKSKTF